MRANSPLSPNPDSGGDDAVEPRRVFIHEPGWRIAQKVGSEREFCYMAAPGEDYYHRLYDGELYLYHAEEKLCLACAERRGLLAHAPRPLRPAIRGVDVDSPDSASGYDVNTDATRLVE